MKSTPTGRGALALSSIALASIALASVTLAADVTQPAEVAALRIYKAGSDVSLTWGAVSLDVSGAAETIAQYRVYRGTTPGFVPDKTGGTNRIGSSATPTFTDAGAVSSGLNGYYLVTAVDAAGNESASKAPSITTLPVLTGNWTETTVDLSWSAAAPPAQIAKYLVYSGTKPHEYDSVKDVGLATATSMTGLATLKNYYFSVVAVDTSGNETAFSNEHVDAVAGRVKIRAHDDAGLCWLAGGQSCPPPPGAVQRSGGFQLLIPVDFPEGNWTRVTATYTLDSRLCQPGQQGCVDKCGNGNPNPGGWNPCGDPWDRTAQLFLVLDNCVDTPGASCITPNNLELIHAVTPFGTDAPLPDGTGTVPPRVLSLDITPFTPLLTGRRYVGAEIVSFASAGWHVTTEFTFSKRPDEVSPKPPADGIQVIGFGAAPLPAKQVSIPLGATQVKMRLFTTGHGGTLYCDKGTNNGATCTGDADCPGGLCQPCDEFCHRTNRILKNGTPIFSVVPFRTDCSPGTVACRSWNACGWPSCTYSRAAWCPGYIACHKNAPCDQDLDLTSQIAPGATYDFSYDVLVQRGDWAVSLVVYWYLP